MFEWLRTIVDLCSKQKKIISIDLCSPPTLEIHSTNIIAEYMKSSLGSDDSSPVIHTPFNSSIEYRNVYISSFTFHSIDRYHSDEEMYRSFVQDKAAVIFMIHCHTWPHYRGDLELVGPMLREINEKKKIPVLFMLMDCVDEVKQEVEEIIKESQYAEDYLIACKMDDSDRGMYEGLEWLFSQVGTEFPKSIASDQITHDSL